MNKHTNLKESLSLNFHQQFKCVGSECTATCCSGWQINLDKSTYKLYKNKSELAPFVQKFKHKDTSRTSQNYGSIKLLGNGDCPYLDDKLLCKVQSNLGEGALSKTCSTFPRIHQSNNTNITQHLSLGCPEVVRLLFNEKNLALQSNNQNTVSDTVPQSDMKTVMSAMIQFIEIEAAPTWQKLLAMQTTLVELNKHTLFTMPELFSLFGKALSSINDKNLNDPGMFQVETIFPDVERLSIDGQRNTLTQIRQNATSYLVKNGTSFESKVKLFIVARELLKHATHQDKINFLDRIAISELYKHYFKFTNSSRDIVNVFTDVAITCAIIRFIVICNFGYNNFEMPKDRLYKIVSLIYRQLGHNSQYLSNVKEKFNEKFGSENIASALLLA